jgi:glyoxylase-like metal-dependent hydrolase (beta-lactamase superfamily II)
MTTRSPALLLLVLPAFLFLFEREPRSPAVPQAAAAAQTTSPESLRLIIPGHYMYSAFTAGRPFSSGIIVTSEGVLVVDTLGSEAVGRAQRESITSVIKQPVRYVVNSSFHDQYSKGNLAYPDIFKIGHENYRTGLVEQMQRGGASADEQRSRLPTATFRDRMTLHFGGKEIQILYFGRAHTIGDSIVFVPQDRIAYLSELFFCDEFPNMAQGYGVSWLRVLDAVQSLEADVFVPGHGPMPDDPKNTRASLGRLKQVLVDTRDAILREIGRGATEDQTVAAVKLPQYEKMPNFVAQRETTVRRMYKELTGSLP